MDDGWVGKRGWHISPHCRCHLPKSPPPGTAPCLPTVLSPGQGSWGPSPWGGTSSPLTSQAPALKFLIEAAIFQEKEQNSGTPAQTPSSIPGSSSARSQQGPPGPPVRRCPMVALPTEAPRPPLSPRLGALGRQQGAWGGSAVASCPSSPGASSPSKRVRAALAFPGVPKFPFAAAQPSPGSHPNLGMGAVGCCAPYGFGVQPPAQFLLGCSVLCEAPAEIYGAVQRARTEVPGAERALGRPRAAFSLRVSWLALQNRPCTTPQARGSAAGDKSPSPHPHLPAAAKGGLPRNPPCPNRAENQDTPTLQSIFFFWGGGGRSCLHPPSPAEVEQGAESPPGQRMG